MGKSTKELRDLWKSYECQEGEMVLVPFGDDRIRVAPETTLAWEALAAIMQRHGYEIRTVDTDSYNCRKIKGSDDKSLHSFGVALDVNWTTNPFRDHAGRRGPRFSDKPSQAERAEDVRRGVADTDMTEAMIEDVLAVRTNGGTQVFEWGGNWKTVKDAMHFEVDLSPAELAEGIDPATAPAPTEPEPLLAAAAPEPGPPAAGVAAPGAGQRHVVVARSGLRLRGGPGTTFGIVRVMPAGTALFVHEREQDWVQCDLEGDGLVDGFAHTAFLRPAPPISSGEPAAGLPAAPLAFAEPNVDDVAPMFPVTPRRNIEANLPFVLNALRSVGLVDKPMLLMALSTIRAETEGFVPISEGRSRFNTRSTPFDLYDAGTSKGRDLGNTVPGDGPRFRGRGYVQLTGRFNYTQIGGQIGVPLVSDPDLANEPATAGRILAQFLKNKEGQIRSALDGQDLRRARRAVNGGSHGLGRFEDAFRRGERALA